MSDADTIKELQKQLKQKTELLRTYQKQINELRDYIKKMLSEIKS